MSRVTVHRRVRPIRFCFLVDPNDDASVLNTIQLNTILWGGRYNPIIPVFDVPTQLTSDAISKTDFIKGNIAAFDPDYIITVGDVDTSQLGLGPIRLRTFEELCPTSGGLSIGLNVMHSYRQRYQAVYQFVQRDPTPMVIPEADETANALFIAACFGDFSPTRAKSIQKAFQDMGGEARKVGEVSYLDVLETSIVPIRASVLHVDACRQFGNPFGVMLLDPTSAIDLLDFWNLRAIGLPVIPVPMKWAEGLSDRIRKIVVNRARELKLFSTIIRRTCFFCSDSVSPAAMTDWLTSHVQVDMDVAIATTIPRFWNEATRKVDRTQRTDISAGEDRLEVEVERDRINFELKLPPFPVEQYGSSSAFANAVELSSKELFDVAGVIPAEIEELDRLLVPISSPEFLRKGDEGLVCLGEISPGYVSWQVPRGINVFGEWLKPRGQVKSSGAGNITRRMIELLGGPDGCHLVTNTKLMKLFESAIRSSTGDISHFDLFSMAMSESRNSKEVAERWIHSLVQRRVLRLGMRLTCTNCTQSNWYSIDDLREALSCHRCLDEFQFPCAMPPKTPQWSYRPLGPFAIEGQGQGAFAVVAAINALKDLNFAKRVTWTTSFELECTGGEKLEVDFALLLQREHWEHSGATVVLGECKTFCDIQVDDVRRLEQLGQMFPGSVLVFATLNDQFKEEEQKLLRDIATDGRKSWKHPVLVLTKLELSQRYHFPFCWRHSGDQLQGRVYDQMIGAHFWSFRQICDASQQIHLGMPPDEAWPHEDILYRREFED